MRQYNRSQFYIQMNKIRLFSLPQTNLINVYDV